MGLEAYRRFFAEHDQFYLPILGTLPGDLTTLREYHVWSLNNVVGLDLQRAALEKLDGKTRLVVPTFPQRMEHLKVHAFLEECRIGTLQPHGAEVRVRPNLGGRGGVFTTRNFNDETLLGLREEMRDLGYEFRQWGPYHALHPIRPVPKRVERTEMVDRTGVPAVEFPQPAFEPVASTIPVSRK